jgi:Ran GTPase-activating protein (RanGAP) involved in mRNA processing and transport
LKVLNLANNNLGPLGARAMAQDFSFACNLESLHLQSCHIEGAEGGQQVGVLLQHSPNLKVLILGCNNLGPLGARAMAPGFAAFLDVFCVLLLIYSNLKRYM